MRTALAEADTSQCSTFQGTEGCGGSRSSKWGLQREGNTERVVYGSLWAGNSEAGAGSPALPLQDRGPHPPRPPATGPGSRAQEAPSPSGRASARPMLAQLPCPWPGGGLGSPLGSLAPCSHPWAPPGLSASMRPPGTRPAPAMLHEQKVGGQHSPYVSWALGHLPRGPLRPGGQQPQPPARAPRRTHPGSDVAMQEDSGAA